MVGKKKGVSGQKEISQAETGEEGKEYREKGGEKDSARRRGGAQRKGRGASRGRECKAFISLVCFHFVFPPFTNINIIVSSNIFLGTLFRSSILACCILTLTATLLCGL